jgi:hypothetical protein
MIAPHQAESEEERTSPGSGSGDERRPCAPRPPGHGDPIFHAIQWLQSLQSCSGGQFANVREADFSQGFGMATILRRNGFRVMIYPNDHDPPHVHVFKGGGEAIIDLAPLGIRTNYRMSGRNLRKALELIEENRDILVAAWDEVHENE